MTSSSLVRYSVPSSGGGGSTSACRGSAARPCRCGACRPWRRNGRRQFTNRTACIRSPRTRRCAVCRSSFDCVNGNMGLSGSSTIQIIYTANSPSIEQTEQIALEVDERRPGTTAADLVAPEGIKGLSCLCRGCYGTRAHQNCSATGRRRPPIVQFSDASLTEESSLCRCSFPLLAAAGRRIVQS